MSRTFRHQVHRLFCLLKKHWSSNRVSIKFEGDGWVVGVQSTCWTGGYGNLLVAQPTKSQGSRHQLQSAELYQVFRVDRTSDRAKSYCGPHPFFFNGFSNGRLAIERVARCLMGNPKDGEHARELCEARRDRHCLRSGQGGAARSVHSALAKWRILPLKLECSRGIQVNIPNGATSWLCIVRSHWGQAGSSGPARLPHGQAK